MSTRNGVCAAYADELTRSGNALGAEAALISARSRRVALLVTDVVAQFRVVSASTPAPADRPYLAVMASTADSRESVRAAGILHRVLTSELSSALRADPIDVGAAVMTRIMSDDSEAFDAWPLRG